MICSASRRLGFAAILVHVGCVGPAPGQESQAIIGGTIDTGDVSVVFLLANYGGQNIESCTAEVISPHVVLTAGHCVVADPSRSTGGQATFSIVVAPAIDENAPPPTGLPITEVHAHPMYGPNSGGSGIHDIAVAILKNPAPVASLPYNRVAIPQSAVGAATRLVGYGISNFQQMSGGGTKRQTTTPLSAFDNNKLHFASGTHQSCYGDSGGPAFQTLGGVEVILGVTSGGPDPCNMGGDYTRVDTNSAFVDQYVNAADPGFLPASAPDLGGTTQPGDGGVSTPTPAAPDAGAASPTAPAPVGGPGANVGTNGGGCTYASTGTRPMHWPLLLLFGAAAAVTATSSKRRWRRPG